MFKIRAKTVLKKKLFLENAVTRAHGSCSLPEACKRNPFRAEPSRICHYIYTEYPLGELRSIPERITEYPWGELRSTPGGLETYFW